MDFDAERGLFKLGAIEFFGQRNHLRDVVVDNAVIHGLTLLACGQPAFVAQQFQMLRQRGGVEVDVLIERAHAHFLLFQQHTQNHQAMRVGQEFVHLGDFFGLLPHLLGMAHVFGFGFKGNRV